MKGKHFVTVFCVCVFAWYAWFALVQTLEWVSAERVLDRATEMQLKAWQIQLDQYAIDHGQELERLRRR